MRISLAVSILLVCACGATHETSDSRGVPIAELFAGTLIITLFGSYGVEGVPAAVVEISGTDKDDTCTPLAHSIAVALDGAPLERIAPGGGETIDSQFPCEPARWVLAETSAEQRDAPTSTFTIDDGDTHEEATVTAAFQERSIAAPTEPVHAGDRPTLTWSTPSDFAAFTFEQFCAVQVVAPDDSLLDVGWHLGFFAPEHDITVEVPRYTPTGTAYLMPTLLVEPEAFKSEGRLSTFGAEIVTRLPDVEIAIVD